MLPESIYTPKFHQVISRLRSPKPRFRLNQKRHDPLAQERLLELLVKMLEFSRMHINARHVSYLALRYSGNMSNEMATYWMLTGGQKVQETFQIRALQIFW